MFFVARETESVCPDWMVEQRGFEPLTSAVDVRAGEDAVASRLSAAGARFGILS
jgi:hypothetical protein